MRLRWNDYDTTRKAAAQMLSISVRSLDFLIANQKLATLRKGTKVMVPHKELVRYASSSDYEAFKGTKNALD